MSVQVPKKVVSAYGSDELVQIVESNEFGPEINSDMAERLIELAKQRTQSRGNPLEVTKDYLLCTTWENFCWDTFGGSEKGDETVPNRFALVTPNFGVSGDAWLCKNAVTVDQWWLEEEDDRRSQIEEIDQSDSEFHDESGVFWAPKDYTALIGFGDGLVQESATVADAM
ncbi:hypothetical protein [Natrinema sp. DC36]|uniref:hypothetical protein n=1 Tax=Natrinema sp. DC36 TaxID=2878680 RepID=UPI001CF01CD1|nr:hypothetical protein [Natrinema sp. DC36]